MTKNLLIADGSHENAAALAEQLRGAGDFRTVTVSARDEVLAAARSEGFDAMLIDARLHDTDGREICRLLRRHGISCPIIILSDDDSAAEQIISFDSGACDFIHRPVRLPELLARLRAHLRQYESQENLTFTVGPYKFLPFKKCLLGRNGRQVRLSPKESDVLRCLCQKAGAAVTRQGLMQEVWGRSLKAGERTLDAHIFRLRQKLGDDGRSASIIVTEKQGYRIAG